MPATNLTQLFDFESQFEAAAQHVLLTNGIAAFISQNATKLPLLNTGIGLDIGPALDVLTILTKPTNWPANQPPPQEYFRYTGALEFRVEVPRDHNGATEPGVDTLFAQLRGKIRAAMMRCVAPFNATNLPFYEIGDIRPNGAQTGYEGVRNIDFISLRFLLTWDIRPDAWPVWIES